MQPGGDFRPDATAWAVLALTALGEAPQLVEAGRQRLAAAQLKDGRLSIAPEHPESYWPTPLAVLAWHGAPSYRQAREQAVGFLLSTAGRPWPKENDAVVGHDPTLKGWSWRSDTVPWVEPTALALMALETAGFGKHQRVEQARELLLDRQLPGGGWNYGNTTVFGRVLRPMPESTGMALSALANKVSRQAVAQSLAYLEGRFPGLKTPWSLGWALLGLGSWGSRPARVGEAIQACLKVGGQGQVFDTSGLALLLLAMRAEGGLMSLLPHASPASPG